MIDIICILYVLQHVEINTQMTYDHQKQISPNIDKFFCSRGKNRLLRESFGSNTLPKTNSSPLKMDGWKTILSFWGNAYFKGDIPSFPGDFSGSKRLESHSLYLQA